MILGSTGLNNISKWLDLRWIFIAIGIYSLIAAVFLVFGIKDLVKEERVS